MNYVKKWQMSRDNVTAAIREYMDRQGDPDAMNMRDIQSGDWTKDLIDFFGIVEKSKEVEIKVFEEIKP